MTIVRDFDPLRLAVLVAFTALIAVTAVAVFYAGQIMELATVEQLFARPAHPYTKMLLGAFSSDPRERAQLARLGVDRVEGLGTRECVFRPRCPQAQAICGQAAPDYQEIEPGHVVRCYFPGGR